MNGAVIGTFLSTKGGVGKTTTLANFGALLTDLGMRVLLIDADLQPSLSRYYPLSFEAPAGFSDMLRAGLISDRHISHIDLRHPDPAIQAESANGCLDLVYSDIDQLEENLESWLESTGDRWWRMKLILSTPFINERYDVVLIDTHGGAGAICQSAIFASHFLISPVSPDIISSREFATGTMKLLATVSAGDRIGLKVPPLHVLICKLSRTRNAKTLAAQLREDYRHEGGRPLSNVSMLAAHIPDQVAFCEAASARKPVHWLDPVRAGVMMHKLLWEVFPSCEGWVAPSCANIKDLPAEASFSASTEAGGQP